MSDRYFMKELPKTKSEQYILDRAAIDENSNMKSVALLN